MPLQTAGEWMPHIEEIIASGGVIVVVGAADVGKTSLCAILANRSHEAGIPTAVVDADVGQSEIGPPTTVGMGIVESTIRSLSDLHPRGLHFIGSTSPVGHIADSIMGARTLVDRCRELGSKQVIVDTTGLVKGLIARQLKTRKIELLRPVHIVALQRFGEAEHFLRLFDIRKDCTIHRLPVSHLAHPKSQTLRTQRRAVRFAQYFREAKVIEFHLNELAAENTYLRTGDPIQPKYAKFASTALRTEVIHGEFMGGTVRRPGGIYLVTTSEHNRQGVEDLKQEFGTSVIAIVPAIKYANLVVGLLDDRLQTLAIGIVRKIDFHTMVASVLTPLKSVHMVRAIKFGVLKLRPDGVEIARLRPGEV